MLPILVAFLMQGAPAAAPAPPRPSIITNPDWLRRPTGEDMAKFYPRAATAANVEGRVVLHCSVTASGDLSDCTTSNETPEGQGFGAAAMSLSAIFKMRPQTRDGVPVNGGKINIPINFRLPRVTPATPVVMRCYGYAAAAAEQDPTSPQAQANLAAWRLLLEIKSLPENQRPSEFESVLLNLRKTGAQHLTSDAFKAEREECEHAIVATPAMIQSLTRGLGG
jgi:TonB family protein